jgi:hypothetical protein
MPVVLSLADVRDVVVIIYGIIGIIFFFIGLIVLLVVGLTARSLMNTVRALLDENVKPALGSVREAADTVRGTTEFVGRTTVAPVLRVYATAAGVKKGLGVLTGLRNKGRR